jgi:hypothetical protein
MNSVSIPSRPAARASSADAATSALVASRLVSLELLTDESKDPKVPDLGAAGLGQHLPGW